MSIYQILHISSVCFNMMSLYGMFFFWFLFFCLCVYILFSKVEDKEDDQVSQWIKEKREKHTGLQPKASGRPILPRTQKCMDQMHAVCDVITRHIFTNYTGVLMGV